MKDNHISILSQNFDVSKKENKKTNKFAVLKNTFL